METKKKKNPIPMIAVLLVAAVFLGSSVCRQVSENEYLIITRFGKVNRIAEPGLTFKLPYPIENSISLEKRLNTYERPLTQTSLKNARSLMVSMYCIWKIADAEVFLRTVNTNAEAQSNILPNIIGSASGSIFSRYEMNDVVTTDAKAHKLAEIEQSIAQEAKKNAEQYGIELVSVGVRHLGLPPNKTQQSLIERMRQEREVESQKYLIKGETEAQKIISEGKAEGRKIRDTALAEAERIRAEGEMEAAMYYEVFNQAPELASFLLKLEALKSALADGKTALILDVNTKPFDLLNDGAINVLGEGAR